MFVTIAKEKRHESNIETLSWKRQAGAFRVETIHIVLHRWKEVATMPEKENALEKFIFTKDNVCQRQDWQICYNFFTLNHGSQSWIPKNTFKYFEGG